MPQDGARIVGRYEILREIGRGGMAVVYVARQSDLDRHVALKELSAFHSADPAFAERFLRESRVAGALNHPNIVTVHEYFEHERTPFIAMEYLPRGSLRPLIGQLSLAQIAAIMEGLLAGLNHAACRDIVHRDLKPENLMITAEGRIKIGDFGIAKAYRQVATGQFLTATGTTVGTPAYMAPEQAMAKDIGPWTDLYSVGVMAYELLAGNVPFHDTDTPVAILLRHVNDPIPPPRSVNPDLDPGLAEWIEALLEKNPSDRPESAEEAWDTLEENVLRILGPRWRREARLQAPTTQVSTPEPLTPAPFHEESAQQPVAEVSEPEPSFQTFRWGKRRKAAPEPEPEPPVSTPIPPVAPIAAAAAAESVQPVGRVTEPPMAPPPPPPVQQPPAEESPEEPQPPVAVTAAPASVPRAAEPPPEPPAREPEPAGAQHSAKSSFEWPAAAAARRAAMSRWPAWLPRRVPTVAAAIALLGVLLAGGAYALMGAGGKSNSGEAAGLTPPPPPPVAPPPPPPVSQTVCRVSNVKGRRLPIARQRITAGHCRVAHVSRVYSASVRKGRIARQSPGAGVRLKEQGKVFLVVSRGPKAAAPPPPPPAGQQPPAGQPPPPTSNQPPPPTGGNPPPSPRCPAGRCPKAPPPPPRCPAGRCPG
jgi:serine/threonine protein kinase